MNTDCPNRGIEPSPSNIDDKFAARLEGAGSKSESNPLNTWAGLHDNVPDRPSVMVAPVGCRQLATMVLKIKTVTIPPKRYVSRHRSCHPVWDASSVSGLSCTMLADFLPPLLGSNSAGRLPCKAGPGCRADCFPSPVGLTGRRGEIG